MNIERLLEENQTSKALLEVLLAVAKKIGEFTTFTSKSQVAFRRKRAFAWAWIPAQYLKRTGLAPLVLTLSLPYRDPSARWKEVVEPSPGKFIHHLELWDLGDADAEVEAWMRKAWELAG